MIAWIRRFIPKCEEARPMAGPSHRRSALTLVPAKPPRPADLGPNQIEFLRANVKNFGFCKAAADAAAEHTRAERARIEGAR